jgi:hypothetical protein
MNNMRISFNGIQVSSQNMSQVHSQSMLSGVLDTSGYGAQDEDL